MVVDWNALGQWASAIITLGGFLAVRQQLKHENKVLETQTREQVYQVSNSVLTMFVDHPGLRSYFYDGIQLPDMETERSKVLAACEVIGDHWEDTFLSDQSLGKGTCEIWQEYMKGIYLTSPSLRYFLLHEGYRYDRKFLSFFDPQLPDESKKQRKIDLEKMGLSEWPKIALSR